LGSVLDYCVSLVFVANRDSEKGVAIDMVGGIHLGLDVQKWVGIVGARTDVSGMNF